MERDAVAGVVRECTVRRGLVAITLSVLCGALACGAPNSRVAIIDELPPGGWDAGESVDAPVTIKRDAPSRPNPSTDEDAPAAADAPVPTVDAAPAVAADAAPTDTSAGANDVAPATVDAQGLLAAGSACRTGTECQSGHCVDDVCCNTACAEDCRACNLAGSAGTCAPVAAGTECKPAGCVGATEQDRAVCSAAGVCQPGTTRDCGNYLCNGNKCGTTCASMNDCKPGLVCTANACQAASGSKVAKLTVHDTARAAMWAVETKFGTGTGGSHPWTDYAASYVASVDTAANGLLGKEWIRVMAASKNYAGDPQATIDLNGTADVYLIVDDRWGATPAWTAGWTNTGWKLRVWESTTRPALAFSIYRKAAQTGSVTLPKIGANNAYNNFVVVD